MLARLRVLLGVMGWLLLGTVGFGDSPSPPVEAQRPADGKLRIIAFGAHPDDAEIGSGGAAALWSASGHHVKLVSVTNGDAGHTRMTPPGPGGPARLRCKRLRRSWARPRRCSTSMTAS